MSVKYLAQRIGVQALVGDETFAALSKFAFEHVAHQFLAFLDFSLARRFQGKPNRQLIMSVTVEIPHLEAVKDLPYCPRAGS